MNVGILPPNCERAVQQIRGHAMPAAERAVIAKQCGDYLDYV
jgi:hypothetical protein